MAQSIYRLPSTTNNARTTTERGRMRFFRTHELLSNLPEHLLSDLERSAREQNFRKKQTIWSPGDTADRVFFVRSGVCKVAKPMDESREITLQFFTRGALIGEYAALFPEPRDTRCEAYEDSTLYAIPREDFQRVLQRSPILGTEVARVIGTRRRRLENRLKNLIFRTAHARLAGLFLDLSEDFGVRDSRGVIVNLKLTHREMAALIGATRETVSFAILDLRKEGLILTEGRRVILLDVERLEALRDQ
jgi:CRP/FNR family cyclic AMP-dependent transcriptional regulator